MIRCPRGNLIVGDIVRVVRKGKFIGWYVRYRDADGGRKMRASHQPSKELARRYLLEIEGRVARGILGIPEPAPPAPTLAAVCQRFLTEYTRPKIKELEKYRRNAQTSLRRVLPILGTQAADAVQPADIERLRLTLSKRWAPATVTLTLNFLAIVYSWAVKAKLVATNPLRGIERPAVSSSIEYLSKEEVGSLLAVAARKATTGGLADRLRYACIFTAVHTGLRRGELYGLRWSDVDLTTRRLTVARSYRTSPKSGKPRHLRLPAEVIPVLAAWARECPRVEALIFPIVDQKPRMGNNYDLRELPELLAEAGCRPLLRPWHALRHTFASHFIMSGGNILTLQKLLGHSDLKMTLHYAHLAPDFLGEEMDRIKFPLPKHP